MSTIFTLDQVKSPDELKVGMTIYAVTALGSGQVGISEFIVASLPYQCRNIGIFIDTKDKLWDDSWFDTCHSLQDSNVIPNNYNKHKWFFTRESAEAYANNSEICNIGASTGESWDYTDDFIGCYNYDDDYCDYEDQEVSNG